MSNYKYSFSGSDMRAMAWLSIYDKEKNLIVTPAIELETLGTLSISIHESKSEVRSLGKRNVSGHTSSIRKIAGSLIFNIVNYHPLKLLLTEYQKIYSKVGPWGWSRDFGTAFPTSSNPQKLTLPTALPPFNILLFGVTELNDQFDGSSNILSTSGKGITSYVKLTISGIELIDDNTTFSVNNILTENTFTFVAKDVSIMEESSGEIDLDKELENLFYEEIDTNIATEPDINLINDLSNSKTSVTNISRIA